MNLAEQILRRKHDAMYKPPVVHPPEPPIAAPESSPEQRQAPSAQPQAISGVDAILTRDGRIRRVRRDTNRSGSMSDINVDLDL